MLSVPAVEKKRYYSVMLCDGNTFNYGYIGSRATGNEAGDYMVVGPDWKGETPPGIKKVFRSTTQFSVGGLSHPALQPGGHAERGEGPGRLQGAAALGVSQAARAARRAGDRLPEDRQGNGEDRTSSSISTSRCSSLPPGRKRRRSARSWPASASAPGKNFDFKDLSPEHKAEVAARA